MKFLIDANLSPEIAHGLTRVGHDALDVCKCGVASARDSIILAHALTEARILISSDMDFGDLLAASGQSAPSVILLRMTDGDPDIELPLILKSIRDPRVAAALFQGCILVIDPGRVRIRALPIEDDDV